MTKIRLSFFLLSIFFVLFSFTPSFFEIYHAENLPKERVFVLEHNYMFDFNFYLSRIRQGQEGRWFVVEKYYNQPHKGSLFQIVYLFLGKIGMVLKATPSQTYHAARFILGFVFLIIIGEYCIKLFSDLHEKSIWWPIVSYLLVVTSNSWPILVKWGKFFRFATHMGWWSVIEALQRITFIPHVLLGQIFLFVFIWKFGGEKTAKKLKPLKLIFWGLLGFVSGIIFPPTLIVVYTFFGVLSILEIGIDNWFVFSNDKKKTSIWLQKKIAPRVIFTLFSFPAFFYLQLMFRIMPWKALALFDMAHRIILPIWEYSLALGPMLPIGIAGMILSFVKKEKKLLGLASWIISIGLLFMIFENVPWQSPSRFTEVAVHIPLGIFSAYLFWNLWKKANFIKKTWQKKLLKVTVFTAITAIVIIGFTVMASIMTFLTDQATAKRTGTFLVPTGAQIIYPLKDFMDGIYYLRDDTKVSDIVLSYEGAGNYIPAYAGNFVYLGHANTPYERQKKIRAEEFFSGKMKAQEAKEFLTKERISYIYFGPQEMEFGKYQDLSTIYQFLSPKYKNKRVVIYKVTK